MIRFFLKLLVCWLAVYACGVYTTFDLLWPFSGGDNDRVMRLPIFLLAVFVAAVWHKPEIIDG